MSIKKLSHRLIANLNNLLYSSRDKAALVVRVVTFLASIAALALLIFIYGFEPRLEALETALRGINIIFYVFLLAFLIRAAYAFQRRQFFENNKFETALMLLIVINGLWSFGFDEFLVQDFLKLFYEKNVTHLYRILVSVYLFVILALEFTKLNTSISAIRISPSTTFILSFLILIAFGTGLLMLPAMTTKPGSMHWLDALFTSVSASCVTGLIVVDTATFFTFKGQVVILMLIQLGGFGIVSFASFFATFIKGGVGIKHHAMLQDFTSSESLNTAKGLLRQVVFITFTIETAAFVLLYFTWGEGLTFSSISDKVFFTAFHAVSAFCNAGFSLFTENLYAPLMREAYVFHIVVAFTVILGGIGFNTIRDLFSPSALRKRLKNPWMEWQVSTKIAVWVSAVLLLLGTVGIYFLERHNTLADQNFLEALIASFFQSTITRTAGFNTIDISLLKVPTLILMILLMFIGGSSNSIAGGIKTSTLYLIIASTIATLKGKEKIEIGRRFIPNSLLFRALSVFFFAVTVNLLGVFILSISEQGLDLIDIAFEQVSAFGTVGLSTGITAGLSAVGKTVLIFTMFIGRVGVLTFAFSLSTRTTTTNYKYPKAHLMVG